MSRLHHRQCDRSLCFADPELFSPPDRLHDGCVAALKRYRRIKHLSRLPHLWSVAVLLGLLWLGNYISSLGYFYGKPDDYGIQLQRLASVDLQIADHYEDSPTVIRWFMGVEPFEKELTDLVEEYEKRSTYFPLDQTGAELKLCFELLTQAERGEITKEQFRRLWPTSLSFEDTIPFIWEARALEILYPADDRPAEVSEALQDAANDQASLIHNLAVFNGLHYTILIGGSILLFFSLRKNPSLPDSLPFSLNLWTPAFVLVLFFGSELVLELYYMADRAIPYFSDPLFSWLRDHFWQYGPALVLSLFLFARPHHFLKSFGLIQKPDWRLIFGVLGFLFLLDLVIGWIVPPSYGTAPMASYDAGMDTIDGLITLLVSACILAPVTEEIIFRGIMFGGLRSHWSFTAAALLSSLIFAAVHYYDAIGMIGTFTYGFAMCWLVMKKRSLLDAIIIHAIYNFYVTLVGWWLYHADYI